MNQGQPSKFICEFKESRKAIYVTVYEDIIPSIQRKFKDVPRFNPNSVFIQYEDRDGNWLDLDDYEDLQFRGSDKLKIICRENSNLSAEEKDQIRLQIINLDNVTVEGIEKMSRVVFFLDDVEKPENREKYQGIGPQYWNILKNAQPFQESFKKYVERIYEESFLAEHNAAFVRTIYKINNAMLEISENCSNDGQGVDFNTETVLQSFKGLGNVWKYIPKDKQICIINGIKNVVEKITTKEVAIISKVLQKATASGALVAVTLASVWLAYDAISSIEKWFKGEITGKRCAANVINSFVTVGVSLIAGFAAGTLAGSVLGPVGTVIAGGLVSVGAGAKANMVISRATQKYFNLPKDVAVENAYVYLGLECTAKNNEVNTAYRKKCLETHPDKGGSHQDFHMTQIMMQTIKLSRGDYSF